MDSSLRHANSATDELQTSFASDQETEGDEHEEPHIHLPNPSFWPLLLSVAILFAAGGLMGLPDNPWITIVAAPFVLVGIMGWALENPMAAQKEKFARYRTSGIQSRFKIGQDVVDKDGHWVGMVQARFSHHILVERGTFAVTAFYVPQDLTTDTSKSNIVRLTVSESELRAMGADSVPDDLYVESAEPGFPHVKGVPMFANGPLSPAETGHYNYGPNFPGINTDASGSYDRAEVRPTPQNYVGERNKLYATSRTIPRRSISPD